jgi:hypothetical protein
MSKQVRALQSRNPAPAERGRGRKSKVCTIDDVVKLVSVIAGAAFEVAMLNPVLPVGRVRKISHENYSLTQNLYC